MSSLLPAGSGLLEQRATQVCTRIGDLDIPLRDLWNPDKCPAQFLPYLAWAFSVDRWDEKWGEADKRRAVNDAYFVHRRKGTIGAVRRVIESFGYSMTLQEWWEVADPAGTFRLAVDVNEIGLTETMLAELERLLADVRPVSRHMAQLDTISRSGGAVVHVGAALILGDVVTVYPAGYAADDSIYYNGLVYYDSNYNFSGDDYGEN